MVKQDVAISYYFRHVRLFMHIMHGTYVRNVLELTELDTAPYVCTSRYDGVCYSLCPRNKTSLLGVFGCQPKHATHKVWQPHARIWQCLVAESCGHHSFLVHFFTP
jgi:hypothetical protein